VKTVINTKTRYEQVADILREEILQKRFEEGTRFYSESELSRLFKVTHVTIRSALRRLEEEGLIIRVQGKGTFVKNLVEHKGHSIGIVGRQGEQSFFRDIYYGKVIEGVRRAIEKKKSILAYQQYDDELGYSGLFRGGSMVEGALVFTSPLELKEELLEYARVQHVVIVGSTFEKELLNSVDSDDIEDSYMAVNYLLDKGHRRILFVTSKQLWEITMDGKWRLQGYTRALEEKGITFRKEFFVFDEMNRVRNMFTKDNRPTALFGAYASPLEEVVKTLLKIGLRIPQDVEVVVYDGFTDEEISRQIPHIVVQQPYQEIGELAVRRLFSLIDGKAQGIKQIKLRSSLNKIGY